MRAISSPLNKFIVLAIGFAVWLTACNAPDTKISDGIEPGMIDAIQTYATGAYELDVNRLNNSVCQQDVSGSQAFIEQMKATFQNGNSFFSGSYDTSGIVFAVEARSGDLVQIKIVSGTGHISAKLPSESQATQIVMAPPFQNKRVILKRENGVWKVCFGAVNAFNSALASANAGSSSDTFSNVLSIGRFIAGIASVVVAALILLVSGWRRTKTVSDYLNLKSEGVIADAEIVALQKNNRITYRFTTKNTPGHDAQVVEKNQAIPAAIYQKLQLGETIKIRYLPADRKVSLIGADALPDIDSRRMLLRGYLAIGIGAVAAAGAVIVAILLLFRPT